jgi:Holliday junction resolvasome RuvABC endonuclease subunit
MTETYTRPVTSYTVYNPQPATDTCLLLDPSLTCFGWAVVQGGVVVDAGCIQTTPTKGVPVYKDEIRRAHSILMQLELVIDKWHPGYCLREEFIGSQSSTACRALSLIKGGVLGLLFARDLESMGIHAAWSKKAATGNPKAEKDEMVQAVREQVPGADQWLTKTTKAQREGIADAIALWIYYAEMHKSV